MRLSHQRALAGILLAAGALSVSAPRVVRAVVSATRIGFPSSVATDGKFLSLPGKGMSSFNVPTHLSIGVPSTEAANPFQVEIFDGDIGGKWDKPGGATTTYELFTDANRDGNAMQLVTSLTNASFVDDDWGVLYTGPHVAAAQAPSGNYFYRLVITLTGDVGVLNACKAAIVGPGQIGAIQNEFSCIGGVVQTGRAAGSGGYDQVMTTTDPLPGTPQNSYDGTFAFAIYVGSPGQSVSLQEGDADHYQDLTAAVAAEAALAPKPGVAADGQRGNLLGGLNVDYGPFMVGGPIGYKIKAPNGTVLANVTDPSGDGEYETVPTFDTTAVGYYRMEWAGVDCRNTFFIKPAFGTQIYSAESMPVGTPLTTGLGGLRGIVFHDTNGDAVKQPNEAGLANVPVTVTNLDTNVTTTVLSNASGEYAAGVPAGPYDATIGGTPGAALGTTLSGPTPVVTVQNGKTSSTATSGIVDPSNSNPSLLLVPECRGTLTHLGLDVEVPEDLRNSFVQVRYVRAGTASLYDAVTFFFAADGRFATPVFGFNKNLNVVNCYYEGGITHVVVDTTASSRGLVRRELRAGDVEVLAGASSTDTGALRPICRPSYLHHGQVVGGDSTVKSLR
jgi:hypothetical protein